jgi:3-phosphoshikimate 1-carboxyvinyltransferase
MSSAFAVAALAAIAGEAHLKNFPRYSWQPDFAFVEALKKMNVRIEETSNQISIYKSDLTGLDQRLTNCPDLFPVLAVLSALARGKSTLNGANHLIHKESNRLEQIRPLLKLIGRPFEILEGGINISEKNKNSQSTEVLNFSPEQDHRLVMAAAVAQAAGYKIHINDPEVVSKSFPEFLQIAEGR